MICPSNRTTNTQQMEENVPVAGPQPGMDPGLDLVLTICGTRDAAVRMRIIQNEGLRSLNDFGILETDTDIVDMAKRMASRTVNEGRVNLGTIQIKNIQALVWWVKDRQKRRQPLDAAEFDKAALLGAGVSKQVEKGRAKGDTSVKDLSTFGPDDYDAHEEVFTNLLVQTQGVYKDDIRYVIRQDETPGEFNNEMHRRMFQMPLEGTRFAEDNRTVYGLLKTFLIDTPGWAWIVRYDSAEDGRRAFWAWANHYNGQGELSKRTALAKANLAALHYRNERSISFEKYTEMMTKAFTTLEKDEGEMYSERRKVEKLLNGINTREGELQACKAVISQNYPTDFVGACSYFSQHVARIHGGAC